MKSVFVLGTNHRVQGSPGYPRSVPDPDYADTLRRIISEESIDFVFEEASGCGRTAAERLCETLGVQYLDVDPHRAVRHEFGIVDREGMPFPDEISQEQRVEEQALREALWCQRVSEQRFESALLVCGVQHTLSLVFRLRSSGFKTKYGDYIPHERLCTRPHSDDETVQQQQQQRSVVSHKAASR